MAHSADASPDISTLVKSAALAGTVIEDYPEDVRGRSCLVLGRGNQERPIHMVCAPKEDYLAIITAYLPEKHEWDRHFRIRRQP